MRLFVALDIVSEIRERIAIFINQNRGLAPQARWVAPESLHVTLKFIGEQPENAVPAIHDALTSVSGAQVQMSFRGTGFFPNPKSARVLWVGIESGPQLEHLASQMDGKLTPLGIAREQRVFSPHLTLARAGNRSGTPARLSSDRPNRVFSALQTQLETMSSLDFGSMVASELCLYQSQLSPKGAHYTKLARFALRVE